MKYLFVLVGLVLSMSGCVPDVQVKTARDPAATFSHFKTFAMLLPNKALPSTNTEVDPFVLQRLRQLTYIHLKALGLAPVAKEQADLVVAVFASRKQRIDVYSTPSHGMYGPYSGYGYGYGYGPGFGASTSQVVRTNEGIVVVDLVERSRQSVVWRGTGVRVVDPDFDDELLDEMVSAILAESPLAPAAPQ